MEIAGWRQRVSRQHRVIARQSQRSRDIAPVILNVPTRWSHPELGQHRSPGPKCPGKSRSSEPPVGLGMAAPGPGAARGEQSQKAPLRLDPATQGEAVMRAGTWVAQALGGRGDFSLIQLCGLGCNVTGVTWRTGHLASCPLRGVSFSNRTVGGLVCAPSATSYLFSYRSRYFLLGSYSNTPGIHDFPRSLRNEHLCLFGAEESADSEE